MSVEAPIIHDQQKSVQIRSVMISMTDVKKIFDRLYKQVSEEAETTIRKLKKPENQSTEDFEKEIEEIREQAFRITITIEGKTGDNSASLFGDKSSLFDSPNLPESISTIFMTNTVAYERFTQRRPKNSFSLFLDFSKPKLLDGSTLVSSPTPNTSHLDISGDRESWIASINEAVMSTLSARGQKRGWLHVGFVYDFGLLIAAWPIGLYACWMASSQIERTLSNISSFLSAAAYLYIFIAACWAYRIFFGYTKWAFPTVELESPRSSSRTHRKFWYVIICGLIVQIIWTLFY